MLPVSSFSKELANKRREGAITIFKENVSVKVLLKLVLKILAKSEVVTSTIGKFVSPAFSLLFSTLKLNSARSPAVTNTVGLDVKHVRMAAFQSMGLVLLRISTVSLLTIKEIVLPVNNLLFLMVVAASRMFPTAKLLPMIEFLAPNVKMASSYSMELVTHKSIIVANSKSKLV